MPNFILQDTALSALNEKLAIERKLSVRLATLAAVFPHSQTVFTTSFGMEDQALTHAIAQQKLSWKIATLDTGRLFAQTYELWESTQSRLGVQITAYYPDATALEAFVSENGPNSFYHSIENRLSCCHIRKVAPLARALQGAALWITGLRAEQSAARAKVPFLEWDAQRQLYKANPLADWDATQLQEYLQTHQVPLNPLHAQGYPSIGCAPCTRAIAPGEDDRAGRWWWEQSHKECGLHLK